MDLTDVGHSVLGLARDGEQLEAVVIRSRDTEVRAYDGDVESLASAESMGVGVRIISADRQGFAYAGTLDEGVWAATVDEARDNAVFGTPDEFLGLAHPDGVPAAELDLYRSDLEDVSTVAKVDLAIELEAAVKAADPRISGVESADFVDSLREYAVVTNTGIAAEGRESSCYLATYALAEEGDDTQTGFGFSVGRSLDDLDVAAAAGDAADRATRLLGATKPPSERLPVVLDPYVTAQLLAIVGSTLSGEAVLKGRSLFGDRMGEDVGASALTLVDDPTDVRAFTATAADGEGLATRRNVLIADGTLEGFVHNTYTARRSQAVSTGSAIRAGYKSTPGVGCQALALEPGGQTQPEILEAVGDGVLISSVSGLHSGVNPVSGDFSTGAEGLRVRGGALAEPIREVTIASTLQRMLQDVVAVGADVEWLPMGAAGVTLAIAEVAMSGA